MSARRFIGEVVALGNGGSCHADNVRAAPGYPSFGGSRKSNSVHWLSLGLISTMNLRARLCGDLGMAAKGTSTTAVVHVIDDDVSLRTPSSHCFGMLAARRGRS
jgi:hypothetical protein